MLYREYSLQPVRLSGSLVPSLAIIWCLNGPSLALTLDELPPCSLLSSLGLASSSTAFASELSDRRVNRSLPQIGRAHV